MCNAIGLPVIWQTELHQWEHDLCELHLGLKIYKQLVQPPTLHFNSSVSSVCACVFLALSLVRDLCHSDT